MDSKKLLVMLKTGPSDRGASAVLGFSFALSSLASLNIDTTVFLVGEGATWAVPANVQDIAVPGFPPLKQLIDDFLGANGHVVVCSTCIDTYCMVSAGDNGTLAKAELIEGFKVGGFTAVAKLLMQASSVTF